MAYGAIGGETRSNVRGIRGACKVCLVAGDAGGRQIPEVVVRVALRACQGRMESRQGPVGIQRVIERDCGPDGGVVAGVAGGREGRGDVTRIRSSGEIGLMAAVAGCGHGCVVVVGVALCALKSGMRTRQREDRSVIESRGSPIRGRVA